MVGGFDEVRRRHSIIGVDRDSDARAHPNIYIAYCMWLADHFEDSLRDQHGFFASRKAIQNDCKLISSQPCDGVAVPKSCFEATTHFDEQRVARRVAMSIVDGLETV